MKRIIEVAKDIFTSINNNPLDIKLLLLFSTLMTLATKYIHLESNKDLYKTIIPYTGWSPGQYYFMFIVFIIIWSYTIKNQQISILLLRSCFIFTFGEHLRYGITDWNSVLPENYTNANPYLRYDSLRPIYTIALPLFWILIHTGSLLNDSFKNMRAKKRANLINL